MEHKGLGGFKATESLPLEVFELTVQNSSQFMDERPDFQPYATPPDQHMQNHPTHTSTNFPTTRRLIRRQISQESNEIIKA